MKDAFFTAATDLIQLIVDSDLSSKDRYRPNLESREQSVKTIENKLREFSAYVFKNLTFNYYINTIVVNAVRSTLQATSESLVAKGETEKVYYLGRISSLIEVSEVSINPPFAIRNRIPKNVPPPVRGPEDSVAIAVEELEKQRDAQVTHEIKEVKKWGYTHGGLAHPDHRSGINIPRIPYPSRR